MVNISKHALGASFISLLLLTGVSSFALTNTPMSKMVLTVVTDKSLKKDTVMTQSTLDLKGAGLTNVSTNKTAMTLMTNHTFFTGRTFFVPPKSANWTEVQDAYRENIFKDVHEEDNESVFRRFEIVFFISLPATLLFNTVILYAIKYGETQMVGGDFETTRNYYLYAGSALMSVGIASQDYQNVKKRRDAEGLRWEILKKKF